MRIGSEILWLDSLASTNSYASAVLQEEMVPDGTVIAADFQTGGRGQQGNQWESEKGKNLLFSIILYPKGVKPADQFAISMVVSLGIASVLGKYATGITIKWPNDIYAGNDKIAGILIENSIAGDSLVHSISGIGININQEIFTSGAPNPVSLKMITGVDHDRKELLGEILSSIAVYYERLATGGKKPLESEYVRMMYRIGQENWFMAEGTKFRGVISGIDNSGCLVVKREDGTPNHYMFKEIEYL